jgi:hypothetical protein
MPSVPADLHSAVVFLITASGRSSGFIFIIRTRFCQAGKASGRFAAEGERTDDGGNNF